MPTPADPPCSALRPLLPRCAADVRRKLHIVHSPNLSKSAKLIKLADKISNVHDIAFAPPDHWSLQRRIEYLQWAQAVVAGLRGINGNLEKRFDETLVSARQKLDEEHNEGH